MCVYDHPEVDRIWVMYGIHYDSFRDPIPSTPGWLYVYIRVYVYVQIFIIDADMQVWTYICTCDVSYSHESHDPQSSIPVNGSSAKSGRTTLGMGPSSEMMARPNHSRFRSNLQTTERFFLDGDGCTLISIRCMLRVIYDQSLFT